MGILIAFIKYDIAKVNAMSKALNLLTLLVSISKYLTEIASKEKRVRLEETEDIVVDCIKDGIKKLFNYGMKILNVVVEEKG